VLTPALLAKVIAEGARRGVPVLVDPKGRDFRRYAGAWLMTPNRGEAEAFTGKRARSGEEVREALKALRDGLSLRAAVITLGADGIAWLDERGEYGAVRTEAREVFDVTGAGDTVIAALACFLGGGAPLGDALRLANVAAGVKVGRVGTAAITRAEILDRLLASPGGRVPKVLDRSAVRAWVARRRAKGGTIVFTNGCFDLLHRGHVEYLRFCRAQGDALVVGLNTDRSVRALKGEGRPVNREADRAEVLAALEAVDAVVLFDEDTPEAIVREVEPDVLVKGEDWREKGVVGREFVEARGGKVVLAPLLQGYSTTGLLGRAGKGGGSAILDPR
jgi:D-beta-D-heptose 7-phosphate kinase/D-beta-D-heptose 1-phosphate adenosyltransferase